MSGPETVSIAEALERGLFALVTAAQSTLRNKHGAVAMAADPATRPGMEQADATFRFWLPKLRSALRQIEAAQKITGKTLRKTKPRLQV